MFLKSKVALVLIGFTVSALTVYAVKKTPAPTRAKDNATHPRVLTQPDSFIAFSADVRETSGPHTSLGKFFRDRNGSTRNERSSPVGPATTITIDNRISGNIYAKDPTNKWAVYHQPKTPRTQPAIMRATTPGLSSTPESTKIDGYEVYRLNGRGSNSLVAPALNFFALVVETSGDKIEYINITAGEPDTALFMPPPGVVVRAAATLQEVFGVPAIKK